jgi:hypothetical protein
MPNHTGARMNTERTLEQMVGGRCYVCIEARVCVCEGNRCDWIQCTGALNLVLLGFLELVHRK